MKVSELLITETKTTHQGWDKEYPIPIWESELRDSLGNNFECVFSDVHPTGNILFRFLCWLGICKPKQYTIVCFYQWKE